MIFVIKKTTDLLSTDIRLILNLYESVFHKRKCYNEFIDEFSQNDFGYSIHAICYDKEVVVGHNVYIPMMYNRGSESFFAALSVDAMVHEDYQNRGIYHRLVMECEEAAKKIGCKIRLGFPNNNSYPIQIKKFGYREIGQLDTYILPVKLDLFSSKYRIFDIFSIPLSFLLIHVSKISKYFRTSYNFLYHKSRETFDLYRYKWFNGNYNIIDDNDVKFIYKEYNFKGKSAFFLMDVFPMSKKNFE